MVKRILFILLLFGVFLLIGCEATINDGPTTPLSFLRTETTEEGEQYSALYYIVDPTTDQVSVLNSMADNFEYYDLENYEVTEETVSFSYEGIGMEMNFKSEFIYEDLFGNTYRMNTPLEEN